MAKKSFQDYIRNFKIFIPFIILQIVLSLLGSMLGVYNFVDQNISSLTSDKLFPGKDVKNIVLSILFFIINVYILAYNRLLVKKVLKDEEVEHSSTIKETSKYYLRYMGLSIILFLIALGIVYLMSGFIVISDANLIVIILASLLFMYIGVIFTPILEYMVYYDVDVRDSFSNGVKIGKKNFSIILFLYIIKSLFSTLLGKVLKMNNMFFIFLYYLLMTILDVYIVIYIMNLCQKEENNYMIN